MFFPIDPGAVHREYDTRIAVAVRKGRARQEQDVVLDFVDYDQQRYAAIGAARERRREPQMPLGPPRTLWITIRTWMAGLLLRPRFSR